MLYYILPIVLLTVVCLAGLLLMVKTFYWGPSGRPPQFRPHDGKLWPDADEPRESPARGEK